jgi:iron complex outermembrane recepter protein
MSRSTLLRGASAGALTVLLVSTPLAQEKLPSIDVHAPRRTFAKPKPPHQTADRSTKVEHVDSQTPQASAPSDGPGSSQQGTGLGGRFTGYTVNVETPAVATKDNIPILQNPVSVQVVPRQLMDDQQAISVEDAIVGNVSSVQPSPDTFYDGFTIRGIPNVGIFRNDLKQFSITHLQTANLQSIEVLKGPAAMLFGRLEPGGVVNLVVKRPLDVPYFSFQEQVGSWGLTRSTVDATGPLTPDKEWLYRLNLSFDRSDSFREFVRNQDAFLAPTVSWRPTQQFRFNFDAEYQNTTFVADADNAIAAIGTRPAPIPISRYLQDPSVTRANPSRLERGLLGFDWTYDIAKDWNVTNRFAYTEMHWAQRITDYDSVDPVSGFVTRGDWDVNSPDYGFTTNLDLNGKFETGPLQHAILVGADYYNESSPSSGVSGMTPAVGPINMYFPTYSLNSYVKPQNNFYWAFRQSWAGVYGQDMISFLDDRAHILLGGRHDWAEYGYGFSPNSFPEAIAPYDQSSGIGF